VCRQKIEPPKLDSCLKPWPHDNHHEGYIDWPTYEANQARIATNTRPRPQNDPGTAGGAVREGGALLQGLASCGHCGRRLRTHYNGRNSAPGYHCSGENLVEGRGSYCLNIGGVQIDEAVAREFIAALEPARLAATVAAAERLEADREATLKQWRLSVERASYESSRAERRYRAVDPLCVVRKNVALSLRCCLLQ
jgi:hypothetical protein